MPQASATFHEAEEHLRPATRDMHRALMSLGEELEAIDWYQQRVDATEDAELREILAHNRDEEQEHASMILEWIRRRDPGFGTKLREYLFTEGPIVGREAALTAQNATAGAGSGNGAAAHAGVGLGSLRRAG